VAVFLRARRTGSQTQNGSENGENDCFNVTPSFGAGISRACFYCGLCIFVALIMPQHRKGGKPYGQP